MVDQCSPAGRGVHRHDRATTAQVEAVDQPDFGITDPTFMINPPTTLIVSHIREWEPRAQIEAIEAPQGEDMTLANIIVRIATGTP